MRWKKEEKVVKLHGSMECNEYFLVITTACWYFVNISLEPIYIELLFRLVCLCGIHFNGIRQEPNSDTIDKTNYY